MPDARNSEQNPMPEPAADFAGLADRDAEFADRDAEFADRDAEFTNRAARRRRGKKRSADANADASVRDTGRRFVGQGPRQWTVRHGG